MKLDCRLGIHRGALCEIIPSRRRSSALCSMFCGRLGDRSWKVGVRGCGVKGPKMVSQGCRPLSGNTEHFTQDIHFGAEGSSPFEVPRVAEEFKRAIQAASTEYGVIWSITFSNGGYRQWTYTICIVASDRRETAKESRNTPGSMFVRVLESSWLDELPDQFQHSRAHVPLVYSSSAAPWTSTPLPATPPQLLPPP